MSISSAHYSAFYKEVAKNKRLWTIKDAQGFPAPLNHEGKRAQPFWSSISRAEKIISNVPAYSSFEPYELKLKIFLEQWIPGLTKDEILVGVNWSGTSAIGFDVEPAQVINGILAHEHKSK